MSPLLLLLFLIAPVYPQTFQYSRGWTNGKRSGEVEGLDSMLERIADNPCQMAKLKYILDGNKIGDKIFLPCDFGSNGDDSNEKYDVPPRRRSRRKYQSSKDNILETFL